MKHHYPEHKQTVLWLSQHHFGLGCSSPSSQMLLHCSYLPVEPSPHISLPDLYHLAAKGSQVEITPWMFCLTEKFYFGLGLNVPASFRSTFSLGFTAFMTFSAHDFLLHDYKPE
jgi:hypothetical protein